MGIKPETFEQLRNYIAMCAMRTGAPVADLQIHLNGMELTLEQRCGAALERLEHQEKLNTLTTEMAGGRTDRQMADERAEPVAEAAAPPAS